MKRIRRVIAVAGVVLATTLGLAGAASAAPLQETIPDTPGITVPETGVSIVVGLILPVLYGIFVRESNPAAVKAIGGIVVAALAALILNAVQQDGTAVLSWQQVVDTGLVYVPQVAAYLGLWKNLDVNARTGPGVPLGRQPA